MRRAARSLESQPQETEVGGLWRHQEGTLTKLTSRGVLWSLSRVSRCSRHSFCLTKFSSTCESKGESE